MGVSSMAEWGEGSAKRRKIFAAVSMSVVLCLAGLLTVFVYKWLQSFSADDFREYIRSFGNAGWLVLLGLQFLQVFIALIPGELLETACGYVLGALFGTVICYLGVAAASSVIFILTKRFGIKFTELFMTKRDINELSFIKNKNKRNTLIFLLYLIPGTPKDLITYFVGLTDIKLGEFLAISLIARLPSVVSSTVGGQLIGDKDYVSAVILYLAVGIVSLIGILIYRKIKQHRAE